MKKIDKEEIIVEPSCTFSLSPSTFEYVITLFIYNCFQLALILFENEVQALRVAPLEACGLGNNLVATLYINRATVLHVRLILMLMVKTHTHGL